MATASSKPGGGVSSSSPSFRSASCSTNPATPNPPSASFRSCLPLPAGRQGREERRASGNNPPYNHPINSLRPCLPLPTGRWGERKGGRVKTFYKHRHWSTVLEIGATPRAPGPSARPPTCGVRPEVVLLLLWVNLQPPQRHVGALNQHRLPAANVLHPARQPDSRLNERAPLQAVVYLWPARYCAPAQCCAQVASQPRCNSAPPAGPDKC